MKESEKLPPEKQEEYILLQTNPYQSYYGWKEGDRLTRVSIWLSGNGCGVRQAFFKKVEGSYYEGTAWEDHVKPVNGQLELDI